MNELQSIYKALIGDTLITSALADGSAGVRADLTDYSGRYPVVVYSLISNVPALFADNAETARRLTVQISVVTENGIDSAIVDAAIQNLISLDWIRESTNRVTDGDKRVTAIRFIKNIES